jgi:hypothetical protein
VVWNESFRLEPILKEAMIYLQVFDKFLDKDNFLGISEPIVIAEFADGITDKELTIYNNNNSRQGCIKISLIKPNFNENRKFEVEIK